MSFSPDTPEYAIRALKEEISKIREEQFSKTFSINSGGATGGKLSSSIGGSFPSTGTATFIPNVIRLTKDTGVIKKLHYKLLTPTKNFAIGETVTGATSGATAIIGDIDITSSTAGILYWKSITGTFTANETINGNINGQAKADLSFPITQTGRGHLNAGSASIIVEGVTMPYEIHFIDNAKNDGQIVLLRAQNSQTIRLRRAITTDANTGNLDLDTSFNIIENAIVILQYQGASNATPTGGWVPILSSVASGGSSTGGIDFPILYPKEDLGDKTGAVSLLLNQSDGHYKRIRMIGNISLTFANPPLSSNGFKFYVLLVQDGTGNRLLTSLPASVKNGADILSQIDIGANAQTLISFVTADGGVTYHSQIIKPSISGDVSQWAFFKAKTDVDMDTWDLFNIDKLRFFGFGGFSFPVDATMQAISTSPVGLQFNVPLDQKYRWYNAGFEVMSLDFPVATDVNTLTLTNGTIADIRRLSFHESPGFSSFIRSFPNELIYTANGAGAVHSFVIDNDEASPNMEMRLNVNKSNRDLNMVTNNIFNLDQAQFSSIQGFSPVIDHGTRTITGGNTGININVSHLKTVKLWFENAGLTNSTLQYEFKDDGIFMQNNNLFETQGIFFTNGGSISDLAILGLEFRAGVTPPFGTGNPQSMVFKVRGPAPSYTDIDIFELTGLEHNTTNAGGMKMSTDLNMQTQNIHQVDMMSFNSNNGLSGGGAYKIAGDFPVGKGFQFNIPPVGFGTNKFSFRSNDVEFMSLTPSELNMVGNPIFPNASRVVAQQFNFNAPHFQGTAGMFDGYIRLVVNGPNSDVWVATGGVLKNLSTLGSTSFINPPFIADGDLNMGTFNIFNLDVLRFVVDGGVIGFGTYGIGVDAGNNSLRYSTPSNKAHLFQINLDDVVAISSSGINIIPNTTSANPFLSAREFLLGTHSIGTGSMLNGSFRKVGLDVFVRTGNTTVNLTTLSAGGADDLGSHVATQPLDMNGNPIINFTSWANAFGQSFIGASGGAFPGISWNVASGQSFFFKVNNVNECIINNFGIDMIGNKVLNSGLTTAGDAPSTLATKSYVDNFAVDTSASYTWGGVHTFNGSTTNINSTNINIGNAVTDQIAVAGHFVTNLLPFLDGGVSLGTQLLSWNTLWLSQKGHSALTIAGDTPDTLTTKNYVDNLFTGGGSFVTTNTDQFSGLTGSKTWDGDHLFNGGLTTFNGSVQLGNSTVDTVVFNARILGNIIPTALANNLGDTTRRWDLFGNLVNTTSLIIGSGATVTTISTSPFANSTTGLMTSSAVQTLVASVGGVSLGGTNLWTGTNTFQILEVTDTSPLFVPQSITRFMIAGTAVTESAVQSISGNKTFNGFVDVNGAFSANGTISFTGAGRPPSGGFVSTTGTSGQLLAVITAHNTMRAGLVSLGLLS